MSAIVFASCSASKEVHTKPETQPVGIFDTLQKKASVEELAEAATSREPQESELSKARSATLAKFGTLDTNVLGRMMPAIVPDGDEHTIIPWPAQMLGRWLIVHRENSTMFVTDGLSEEWDPELRSPEEEPWGFELAIEVPRDDKELVPEWLPSLAWYVTDWIVQERIDIRGLLEQFDVVTIAIGAVHPRLEPLVADNGAVGLLVGIPYGSDELGMSTTLAKRWPDNVSLLNIKLLTKEEYEFAMQIQGSARSEELAKMFIAGKDRHLSDPSRKSIIH